jgi:serine/threonine-protein kinase
MATDRLDDFLAVLGENRLIDASHTSVFEDLKIRHHDPEDLAAALQANGILTPFQVEHLLRGEAEQLVLGQYILLEPLGKGGMGAVYKARHKMMRRIVALKVIRTDLVDTDQATAVQRFLHEIEAASALQHPNVVMAYDANASDDTLFFVMEYVDGIDLGHLVRRVGYLPIGRACDYIRQAALGLAHAHERGLIHRDIKPSNLLLCYGDSVVKVLDLGLARLRQPQGGGPVNATLTHVGMMIGTPDFMAPEQSLDARTVDRRSDLYGLGCTLYFLLTGQVPFPEGTFAEKLLKHHMGNPTPIEDLRRDIPAGISAVVRKLMAKNPEARYQTGEELAQALVPFATPEKSAEQYRIPKDEAAAAAHESPTANQSVKESKQSKPPSKSRPAKPTVSPQRSSAAPRRPDTSPRPPVHRPVDDATPPIASKPQIADSRSGGKGGSRAGTSPSSGGASWRPQSAHRNTPMQESASGWKTGSSQPSAAKARVGIAIVAALAFALIGVVVTALIFFKPPAKATTGQTEPIALVTSKPVDTPPPQTTKPLTQPTPPQTTERPKEDRLAKLLASTSAFSRRLPPSEAAGKLLLAGGMTYPLWLDANTGLPVGLIAKLPDDRLRTKADSPIRAALSPDGRYVVASGLAEAGPAAVAIDLIKRPSEPAVLDKFLDAAAPTAIQAGIDGRLLVATFAPTPPSKTSVNAVCFWQPWTAGALPRRFGEKLSNINLVAITPRGDRAATYCYDDRERPLRIWDLTPATPTELFVLGGVPTAQAEALVFSSDGSHLYLSNKNAAIAEWDLGGDRNKPRLLPSAGPGKHTPLITIMCLAVSPDGRWLLSAGFDAKVLLWDLKESKVVRLLTHPADYAITCAAFSPDSKHIATAGHEGAVRLFDVDGKAEPIATFKEHRKKILAIAFSPDGKYVVTVADDSNVLRTAISRP